MPDDLFDARALLQGLDIAEVEERHKRDSKALVLAFLEILDSLQALQAYVGGADGQAPDPALSRTVEVMVRQALRSLGAVGVIPLDAVGQR